MARSGALPTAGAVSWLASLCDRKMLTLFSIPKPFEGHIGVIQRNAIESWIRLKPKCEIILFGNEKGAAEICNEFGIKHIPEVDCNEYGTPLVNSLFDKAQEIAKYQLLCYVNADIILTGDFLKAVQMVKKRESFLLIGQRTDVNIDKSLDFSKDNWEKKLRAYTAEYGKLHSPAGIDYFVFSKGLFHNIHPFAIGRTAWDNWLIYRARSVGALVIDITKMVTVIHQNHSYFPYSQRDIWQGQEAIHNQKLAGGRKYNFNLRDATHLLTSRGLRPALTIKHLRKHLNSLAILHPKLSPLVILVKIFLRPIKIVCLKFNLLKNEK